MSNGKTACLGLNQWVLEDPFLMEEMNQDNRKIDAGFRAVNANKAEFVKLKEITTTTGGITQIDIDVSDIDFGKYQYVFLDTQVDKTANLRVNNDYYSSSVFAMGGTSGTAGSVATYYNFSRSTFSVCENANSGVSVVTLGSCLYLGHSGVTYGSLKTFSIVVFTNSDTFAAGNRFSFWGVK